MDMKFSICRISFFFLLFICSCFGFDLPPSINQNSDWLLISNLNRGSCPKSQFTVDSSTGILTLSNGLILRSFLTSPCFSTIEYQRSSSLIYPTNYTFLRTLSPEGNISFDGVNFDIGGCQGIPWGHAEFYSPDQYFSNLSPSNRSFTYLGYSLAAPVAPFSWEPRRGAPTNIQWPPKGLHVSVSLNPPTHPDWLQFTGVSVTIHYEIYDCLPLIRKWVTVQNDRKPFFMPIEITGLLIEMLRMPNGAPERTTILIDKPFNPTPWDDQILPVGDGPGIGNSAQIWFTDPDYDQCCDQALHVPYTYYTYLQSGYALYDEAYGGPVGPGVLLGGGMEWESICIRTVLHDTNELERKGFEVRRIHSFLAPQLMENPLSMMISNINSSETFEYIIEQGAKAGLEMLVIGYGADGYCGLCDGQMFNETWRNWFAGEVSYAHSNGLEVTAYTLMQHNGWGEDTPANEQVLGSDGTRQGIACFATDWHAQYRYNILEFMKNVSLDGIETDGQYEYAACHDATGDHNHNGVRGSWGAQLYSSTSFNIQLKAKAYYQSGADAYSFSGANRWNHADTDPGFGLKDYWEYLSMGRLYCYDSTFTRLPASGMYGLNDITLFATNFCGMNQRLLCIDFAIATFIASGSIPVVRADFLAGNSDPDKDAIVNIFSSWNSFWKKYRQILIADFIHIIPATNRLIEATAHIDAYTCVQQSICGIVTIINPTAEIKHSGRLTVNLYLSSLSPGTQVWTQQIQDAYKWNEGVQSGVKASTPHIIGQDGVGIYEILLEDSLMPPRSYVVYLITSSAPSQQKQEAVLAH